MPVKPKPQREFEDYDEAAHADVRRTYKRDPARAAYDWSTLGDSDDTRVVELARARQEAGEGHDIELPKDPPRTPDPRDPSGRARGLKGSSQYEADAKAARDEEDLAKRPEQHRILENALLRRLRQKR